MGKNLNQFALSDYWEISEAVNGDMYALSYDGEIDKWCSYRESDRVEWDLKSGVLGFFYTQDPQFWVPNTWEMCYDEIR